MNIDSIQNGVVLDHIQAGKSMDIYNYLDLDKLDYLDLRFGLFFFRPEGEQLIEFCFSFTQRCRCDIA